MKKILVIPGSLRQAWLSQSVARGLVDFDLEGYDLQIVQVDDLPLYNEELEWSADMPQAWTDFRTRLTQADAVLFVTPEYNRNTTPTIANAINVGSRPYQDNYRNNKKIGIISVTGGPLGGYAANTTIRESGALLNMDMMAQPNGHFPFTQELLNEDGSLTADWTSKFQDYLTAFTAWLEKQ